ncbi:MAG TPA: response regulator transcription factor [Rhodothermales bacterium]|nr:response regulator transcription factor [Rhodothermales bacterium]
MPPPGKAFPHGEALFVWIVEDDDLYRASVTTLLEQTDGLACTGAFGTCEAALAALDAQPPPDIVLMDLSLPGMSGTEGIGHIKALVPTTEIIVLSIHRDHDRVFEAIRAGATGYLLKTASAGRIIEAIHEVRRGGAPINAHIARRVLHLFAELAGPKQHYGLTQREREILELMNENLAKKEIAEQLFLSYYTIDTHVKNIYAKLHVHSRSEAILKARRERLI